MTSKTSFFNIGIYKETVRRFLWGSILYFIILFISSSMSVMITADSEFYHMNANYFADHPIILSGHYMGIPIVLSIVIPTIVALMIFRFIHSKGQAIFVHSLPVSRKAIYISSVTAAFTLMFLPVVMNGIILAVMSFTRYGIYFEAFSAVEWTLYNMLSLFMMFSCAVLSATLTGNSFSMIVINILIHSFAFITASSLSVMAETFLYGYTTNNAVIEFIIENNLAVSAFSFMETRFIGSPPALDIIKYILISAVLYVISYFLYKRRNVENAGDIAAFKCLNHIFKYAVTLFVTLFGFAVFSQYTTENGIAFAVILLLISIVAYAASEMLLKKTLNVLYSWKGYVGFAICFSLVTMCFAFTSFFGYETQVPNPDEIKKAAIYNYYFREDEPYVSDEISIAAINKAHSDLVNNEKIPVVAKNGYTYHNTYINIVYELENGRKMSRRYPVSEEKRNMIMNDMYKNTEIKKATEPAFIDKKLVRNIILYNVSTGSKFDSDIIDALRDDIMNMDYQTIHDDLYNSSSSVYSLEFEYITDTRTDIHGNETNNIRYYQYNITPKFKNTYNQIKEAIKTQ